MKKIVGVACENCGEITEAEVDMDPDDNFYNFFVPCDACGYEENWADTCKEYEIV